MTDIQRQYAKTKRLYMILLAVFLTIIVASRLYILAGGHDSTLLEGLVFFSLLIIGIIMYMVLRCPQCRAFLLPAYSMAWGRLRNCPECAVTLIRTP
jgi:uncharacterized integral membrane protein